MQNQPIGSQVTLDAVMVSEIGSGYLVVNEMFDSSQKVRVQAYARVNWRQCVEVTGTLAQSGGEKYLANAQVYEYVDIAGNPLPIVPKGIDPNSTSATIAAEAGQKVLHLLSSDNVSYTAPDYGISAVQIPPFAMPNRSIGGPEISQPQFYGVANTGLLISTWGKIVGYTSASDCAFLSIDDGSQVPLRIDVIDPVYLNTSGYARITGVSDTIVRTELRDDLQGIPENTPVRRVVAYMSDVRDCSDAAASSMPTGSISGNIYANVKPTLPTRIYTAYGSTIIGPDDWQYDGSRYSCPYTLSGVPGRKMGSSFDPTYAGIITAKSPGFGSVSKFAAPGSTGINIDLANRSILHLDISSSSSSPLECGESAVVSAHLYDSEGLPLPDQQITFTATNGEFSPGVGQLIVDTDANGKCSVNVSPTGECDITVTAAALGIQNRAVQRTKREILIMWSDPPLDNPGGTATIYAKLYQPNGVTPISGENIAFNPANGSVNPLSSYTNAQGIAQTIFTRGSGNPSVTATWTNACGWQISGIIGIGPEWDWPMFHKDIAHTGVTNTALYANLAKKWVVQLNGNSGGNSGVGPEATWASPVVAGNVVYAGTNAGWLYAFNASTGIKLGEINLGAPIHGTPCVDNGLVYVCAEYSGSLPTPGPGRLYVFALNPQLPPLQAFIEQWHYDCRGTDHLPDPNQRIWGSPVVFNGAVHFGSTASQSGFYKGWFHTIDIVSGQDRIGSPASMKWAAVGNAPGIDANYMRADGILEPRAYLSDYSCYVTAIKCQSGAKAWNDDWSADELSMFASPVIYQDVIYVGSDDNCVYKLKDDGDIMPGKPPCGDSWRLSVGEYVWSTPAAYNGKLYFGCNDNRVYCVDAAAFTSPTYSDDLGSWIVASPAISAVTGQIFVSSLSGKIYALDISNLASKTLLFDIQADDNKPDAKVQSSPALANGRMYIIAGNSNYRYLYCFGN